MTGRLLKLSVVALAFLVTTTPARADTVGCCFKCYLDGVDRCGCLTTCGGECAEFYACVNVCSGQFTGKACGRVKNCSCCLQYYKCRNFFCDPCWKICVSSSCYAVGRYGSCTYTACGTVY
jgi:hypothetical protein